MLSVDLLFVDRNHYIYYQLRDPMFSTEVVSDIFGCRNCKKTGDKWYMQIHDCSGKG